MPLLRAQKQVTALGRRTAARQYSVKMFSRPRRTIVAQYSAPAGLSVLAAAELLGDNRRAIAAQVIDLVVRKALTIAPIDLARKKKSGFEVTLANPDGLDDDAHDLIVALFPKRKVGKTVTIAPGANRKLGARLRVPHRRAVARLVASGNARERTWLDRALTPWRRQPVEPTPVAFPIVDHLWGIRDYIALAEKDRIAFLQSPSGALLRADAAGSTQALILNEKLLPYAILFGLEKQWIRELDLTYRSLEGADFAAVDVALDVLSLVDAVDIVDSLELLDGLVDALDGVGSLIGGAISALLD